MKIDLGRAVILVEDYDEAFEFYKDNFGCKKFFDITNDDGERFLHISFDSETRAGVWFLKANTTEQQSLVGRQTGGAPVLVLYTDDFDVLNEKISDNGIEYKSEPEITEEFKSVSVFDLYGNEIVIVQLLTTQ
ncbi:MAG TPA: VOC family protein [Ignavibacteria bacterium]|nr:VOC family protein [Ignavibacteria bacterium]